MARNSLFPILAVSLAFLAGRTLAAELAVYPTSIHLTHARDVQAVVLVFTRDDGITEEVTGLPSASFQPEGIASWSAEQRLAPLADGETTLTLSYSGNAVTLPVKVSHAAITPPVSFRNDVQPVLMRAGCNAGSCHGSAQGKNGFRLTLFGYNPDVDYLTLTRHARGRRLDAATPEESLMLLKPLGTVDHEGGTRFAHDSPLYGTLAEWIEQGAQQDPPDLRQLTGVEILPKNCVLDGEGATQRFIVRATYSDGVQRDVTGLALLSSSDDSTLSIDERGQARAGNRGEVYILARFGSFAVVAQAIVLPKGLTLQWPGCEPANFIDSRIFEKLKKLRIPPAALCSDEVFVRRVYLDILGVLPTVAETQSFLADPEPGKRAKLIDTLLVRPEFPELWAMKWADLLRVRSSNTLDPKAMHRYNDWLRGSIASGKPIHVMAKELITAQGGTFASPAANFYVVETDPALIAENVAQVFLGIQIKCAQCHNHPFERWTMDDYYGFAAFFSQVGRKASSDPRESIIFDRRSGEVSNLRDGLVMAPKLLDGAVPDVTVKDRRMALAEWLASPENPWFAKNIANRVWAHFFGRGIIEPPDDVRVTNPPTHPDLLEELASRLVASQYDLRSMVRDICNSHTYQMSTTPADPNILDERNFSHSLIRRLPAEQLLDAMSQVAETKFKFPNLPLGARAAQVADGNSGDYFLGLFGRPIRDTVCTCERKNEPTLAQTLHLINGNTIQTALQAASGRVTRLAAPEASTRQSCEELYLAAFSRPPQEAEFQALEQFVASSQSRQSAFEDILWSVLNSKEFIFNH
jgi:hypothetical protein